MNGILTAIFGVFIFIVALIVIYIVFYNSIQALKIKITEAESRIDELLRKKYDTLNNIKDITLDVTKLPKKTFDEFDTLKEYNISSFDLERKLTEYNSLIDKILSDHKKLEDNEPFNNYYEDIHEINEKLEAAKAFYNKYTAELNTTIKKFPSNIIAFFHHIKVQAFFDGKDMFDDDIKDFKL